MITQYWPQILIFVPLIALAVLMIWGIVVMDKHKGKWGD